MIGYSLSINGNLSIVFSDAKQCQLSLNKAHAYSTARSYPQMNKTETNGLISIASKNSVAVTIQCIEQLLVEQGVNMFGVVDHGAAAHKAHLELDETQVIFLAIQQLAHCGCKISDQLPLNCL